MSFAVIFFLFFVKAEISASVRVILGFINKAIKPLQIYFVHCVPLVHQDILFLHLRCQKHFHMFVTNSAVNTDWMSEAFISELPVCYWDLM